MHGPYAPEAGHRFNPAKLLLDPYAKAIAGVIRWSDALFGYTIGHPDADLSRDTRDSAADLPKCIVVDPAFRWGDDTRLRTPWHKIQFTPGRGFADALAFIPYLPVVGMTDL